MAALIVLILATPVPTEALVVTDAKTLMALEQRGATLGALLGGRGTTTTELHQTSPAYRDLVKLLSLDADLLATRDPKSGVGFGNLHRAFDVGWLRSSQARFELIGVVNRLDRRHVAPNSCGERRLIYRLAYATKNSSSRLPMTLNVVLRQERPAAGPDCKPVADRWLAAAQTRTAQAYLEGPLAKPWIVDRVETNLQSVRYPSGVRPRLGGHAGYILRVFPMKKRRLSVGPLENTPTVTLGGKARKALRSYLRDHLKEIDDGTLVLPDSFLAKRSVSVAPRGVMRIANRPYRHVVGPGKKVFARMALDGLSQVKSVAGIMRRLETMSCKGCHQSGSLAGFHFLGEERDDAVRWNALAVGLSPHLLGELEWRKQFFASVLQRTRPGPRPFAERTSGGHRGAACGVGTDATFATWTCDDGLVCRDNRKGPVGACGPKEPLPPGSMTELSTLTPGKRKNDWDRVRVRKRLSCAPFAATRDKKGAESGDGFPAGMCHAKCTTYGERRDGAVCGPIPFHGGKLFGGFTKCLVSGKASFAACAEDSSKHTWLMPCDVKNPCREDYLCTRVPGLPKDEGACVPTYFLAQLRVDGHAISAKRD